MSTEEILAICRQLPGVSEDIKWEHDLVFSVGGKMFCALGIDESPVNASFKVNDDEFEEISSRPGFKPAPYLAKHKWVWISDINKMKKTDWKKYIEQSHALVASKLSAKLRKEIGM